MNLNQETTATFETLRGRLFGLAYRMLGSRADAEDVVQEAYLRWHQRTNGGIENPEAWLVTTTTRIAIIGCGASRPNARRTSDRGCPNRSWRNHRPIETWISPRIYPWRF